MSFYEHATEFAGRPVVDFQPGQPLANPQATAYRIRVDYEDKNTVVDLLHAMLEDPAADRIPALVIGAWMGDAVDNPPTEILEALVSAAGQLSSLTALFLGDIVSEENEVSWINQTDVSPLWNAFPRLEHLKIRGSQGLSLGTFEHAHLRSLAIECGGLPRNVLHELAQAQLPSLEDLELYLGEEHYGWDGTIEDLRPLLADEDRFPRLTYLGLRDSVIADQVAELVVASPLLKRIEVLDLSLGTLGDEGGRVLLACPEIRRLKRLDLHRHYMSDDLIEQFKKLPIEVDVSEQEQEQSYGRYVAVGE